jgi:NADH-quinone oxidoreductase subunit G
VDTETTRRADAVIPVATFAESSGTLVNNEGRAQRYYPVLPGHDPVKDSWKWIADLFKIMRTEDENPWLRFDDVVNSLTHYYPAFAAIKNHLPNEGIRYYNEKIARQTQRFSGRTAITANISVSEPAPPNDTDTPLKFSMEGYKGEPPSNLIPYYWSPGWNSPQAVNKYLDEPNGSVKNSDPGIRLLDNKSNYVISFSDPPKPGVKSGDYLVIAAHRIFGSEELSSEATAIAELIPDPFVLLNGNTLKNLTHSENDIVTLEIGNSILNVRLQTDDLIPDGILALSWPLPGLPYLSLPATGKFSLK